MTEPTKGSWRTKAWGWALGVGGPLVVLVWAVSAAEWLWVVISTLLVVAGVLHRIGVGVITYIDSTGVGLIGVAGVLLAAYLVVREVAGGEPGWGGLVFFLALALVVCAVIAWMGLYPVYQRAHSDVLASASSSSTPSDE